MLERTHFANGRPNEGLVYELRQRAFYQVDLTDLLSLITDRLQIPPGEVGGLSIVLYLGLAFGGWIPEGKGLAGCLERTQDGYIITEPSSGEAVVAQVKANRSEWCTRLGPEQK